MIADIDAFYASIDALDLDRVVAGFAPDGEVVFGNNPAAVGREAIAGALGGFWASIGSMRHERRNLWAIGSDTHVLEAICHYGTKGGAPVPLPVTTVIESSSEGLVTSLRVYIDMAPLFAAVTAEAAD